MNVSMNSSLSIRVDDWLTISPGPTPPFARSGLGQASAHQRRFMTISTRENGLMSRWLIIISADPKTTSWPHWHSCQCYQCPLILGLCWSLRLFPETVMTRFSTWPDDSPTYGGLSEASPLVRTEEIKTNNSNKMVWRNLLINRDLYIFFSYKHYT